MRYNILLSVALVSSLLGCPTGADTSELEAALQELQQSRVTDQEADNGAETSNPILHLCNTPEIRRTIHGANHDFAEHMNSCVEKDLTKFTASLNIPRVSEKYPEISTDCLACFGEMVQCTANNCKSICRPTLLWGYGETSIECRDCSHSYCGAEMIKCTGLPPSEWPDFQR